MENKEIGLYYFSKNSINYCVRFLFVCPLLVLLSSCASQTTKESVEIKKLHEYDKIVTNQDAELANPTNLRYNSEDSLLFVYDGGQHKVLKLNTEGQVVDKFGMRGRGPGEFLKVKNIFLTDNNLYTVDPLQFRITQFSLEGGETQTLNYGNGNLQSMPPPAPQSLEPRAQDINNQPVITLNGNVLLPNIQLDNDIKKLYRLIEWKNKQISEIGDIPNGSLFTLDYDKYKSTIAEKERV
jgi:hypothetical protein